MTQHITVISTANGGTVVPEPASVWRDDQVIMWGLAPGLEWIDDIGQFPLGPIEFLPAGDGFSTWLGSTPEPMGDRQPDQPDRRFYVAMCNFINPTSETIRYHYKLHVKDVNGNVLMVGKQDDQGGWIDPDVGNEPQP